ncbi:hypothetical protein BCR36DRAFT_71843 [Piromyces finnis]|uniref:AH domain-containing protein n=1 Tax=Piromyces finnis TaxID=1754191 RepID=A0A1Y1V876_9FUNG|nr:hypothetical protein BCR36DRAFT_71843 [Piromyces finnis]|eukprot:ORX49041.1 hypothetical protein BCR36DRAFT_71843 [Piromyces finnis]
MTNKAEKRQSYNKFGFKMAILGQTFMESIQNTFNNTLGRKQNTTCVAPMVDGQVDEATKKVENLKKFIEGSQKSIKKIIDSMTASIEAEQALTSLFSEESCREDKDIDLRIRYIRLSDSFNKDNKELSKYIVPLKNYEEWLTTFLTKAIKDTEETINHCNQVRIEMQSYASCCADAKNRLKNEVEGSMEHLSDKTIIEESERHLDDLRKKFADLKIQLKEKAEMLELKRQVDLPNYLDTVNNAIRLYHQAAFAAFALPTPKDSEIDSIHTNNESVSSEENVSLHSLPSSLPNTHINSNISFGPR